MHKVMTWQEIEGTFDGEWALIQNPEYNEDMEVISGKVVYSCNDREELRREFDEARLPNSKVVYVTTEPVVYLLNWGIPGGWGIYDWSEADLAEN